MRSTSALTSICKFSHDSAFPFPFSLSLFIDQEDVELVAGLMWVNLQQIIVLADFDGDWDVDDSDLSVIRINYGMTGATKADGDLNGDTIVNELDIDLAFAQYGLWLDLVG